MAALLLTVTIVALVVIVLVMAHVAEKQRLRVVEKQAEIDRLRSNYLTTSLPTPTNGHAVRSRGSDNTG